MIGYMTVGTNDLEKAGLFYDELFTIIGAQRFMADDHIIIWTTKPGMGMFSVIVPNDGETATVGNGTMVAFVVDSFDKVERMHAKVLEMGGTDAGEPGPRGESYSFAYARDLEGNKMAFFCKQ